MKINISSKLYKKIEQKLGETGFKSVEEFVEFKLNEMLLEEHEEQNPLSNQDRKKIQDKLKNLGYID